MTESALAEAVSFLWTLRICLWGGQLDGGNANDSRTGSGLSYRHCLWEIRHWLELWQELRDQKNGLQYQLTQELAQLWLFSSLLSWIL